MVAAFEILAHTVTPTRDKVDKLNAFVLAYKHLHESHSADELRLHGYREYKLGQTIWYFHPDLDNIINAYSLSRYAMLVNMREKITESGEDTISKFIYTQDKKGNREGRGIGDDIYDRFDTFVCTLDGLGGFRKNGSLIGPAAMSKLKRDTNKAFLQILMHGDIKPNRKLTCAWGGEVVESIATIDDNENLEKLIDIFDLHHAVYLKRASVDKTKGPSAYLNKLFYKEFTHEIVMEFLTCIVLSSSNHDRIHKAQPKDDITGWLKKYKRGELTYIPFHWENEVNYNITINKLSQITCLDLALVPTYNQFIYNNTLVINRNTNMTPTPPTRINGGSDDQLNTLFMSPEEEAELHMSLQDQCSIV